MKILILGGTRFVGRHLVAAALARGHEITLFNRGQHATLPDVEIIRGDRNRDLDKLRGRRWDAVIDTCGYLPRNVKASAEALADAVDRYVFISSQSVYGDLSVAGIDEKAFLATLTGEQLEEANAIDASGQPSAFTYGKLYGGLKALCEQATQSVLPNRVLIIRPGLVVGPHDYSDRFTYWVVRVARGGDVLAPGPPGRILQYIDVRDLAEWIVRQIELKEIGVYNATGPAQQVTMEILLEECKKVSNGGADLIWVDEDFLLQEKVAAWPELPLWLPDEAAPHLKGFMFIKSDKAVKAGLTFRELRETIKDTLTWHETNHTHENLQAGLDPEREQELLRKWRN